MTQPDAGPKDRPPSRRGVNALSFAGFCLSRDTATAIRSDPTPADPTQGVAADLLGVPGYSQI